MLRRVVAGARNTRFLRLVEHHNLCDEVLDAAQVRGSQIAGFAEAPVHKHVLNGHVQLIASFSEAAFQRDNGRAWDSRWSVGPSDPVTIRR